MGLFRAAQDPEPPPCIATSTAGCSLPQSFVLLHSQAPNNSQVLPPKMNWRAATCWALLLAATLLCDIGETKGGRGGARGSARGGLRGARARVRPVPRYSSSSLRVAAMAGSGRRRVLGPWESGLEDEDAARGGNGTSVSGYRAWTSASEPTCSLRLCLLLGSALSALGRLQP
ncbi:shadow of prion protein isoform X1 [Saccopteryx bilineata]|uniref:shadow of prion protein isoform X1 n=2 Tax=Saccopteryx bilineata TaxID=59482 RepID=UPI0033903F4F